MPDSPSGGRRGRLFLPLMLVLFPAIIYAVPWIDSSYTHASDSAIEAFKDLKFGLRIHWGPYCIDSTVNNRHNGESWCLHGSWPTTA